MPLNEMTASGGLCPVCLMRSGLVDEPEQAEGNLGHLKLPHTFGPYELIEELGRGGMGVVYAARQAALDRTVAIKLVLSGAYASETALQRFRTEAAAAAGLQHPNIVEIHDYGEVEGQPYYLMDLVTGRDLAEVCEGRPLPALRAANLLRELADAVHYAHGKGILHRDLKPSNVLLDERDRPRITDFGLARRMDADGGVTMSGQMLGSPSYVSPEQAAGRSTAVGVASDIYGLGALFYHLLTGRAPFNAASPTDTLRLVLETDPPPPRLLNPTLPRDLETICLTCLAKDPARRYATAAEVGADIERFLENRPIRARPPSVVYQARKFVRRYRTGVIAVAAVIVALAAGLTAALISNHRAIVQKQAAEAARVRSQEMVNFIMQKSLPYLQNLGQRQAMVESAETAVRYFDQLPPALRNRETMRAHATALDLLINAYRRAGFGYLPSTDPKLTLRATEQAAVLWRQLAETDPSDADAMAAVLLDEFVAWTADPTWSTVRSVERDPVAQELLVRFRDLRDRFPENAAVQDGMGELLGYLLSMGMREIEAEVVVHFREVSQQIERLLARTPGDPRLRLRLARTWSLLAEAHTATGDREAAVRSMEKALAIADGLLAQEPTNLQTLAVTAILAMNLMFSEQVESRLAERARVARRYLATLIALDPEDPEWRYRDAQSLTHGALAWLCDRRFSEALTAFDQAVARYGSLPPGSHDRIDYGETLRLASLTAQLAGERARAAAMFERLQAEFMQWAQEGATAHERSLRRFLYLYWQNAKFAGVWNTPESLLLARDMLAEAERRAVDAPDVALLPSAYRAGAQAFLGQALLEQGRAAEAVPPLEEAVQRFRDNPSMAPFYAFAALFQWEAAENLARALQQTGDRQRAVEMLEWAYAKRDAYMRAGGLLGARVGVARCAWLLAQALDPDDPAQAARQREVLDRALELLDDPETAPRLTPEERELRAQIADILMNPAQETPALPGP